MFYFNLLYLFMNTNFLNSVPDSEFPLENNMRFKYSISNVDGKNNINFNFNWLDNGNMWERRIEGVGSSASDLHVTLRVKDEKFFSRVLLAGDIGFGEAYQAGDFETDNLTGLIRLLIDNAGAMEAEKTSWAIAGKLRNRLIQWLNKNTVKGSRRNIYAHYDLGNDFFKLFLDPTMMYSCARFEHGDTLEAAQMRKVHSILDKADVRAGDHVLEIGSGWGTLAVEAVKRGARITTLTMATH
jgi:cyclopropane-fatty-acyl-phospholipid synthase